jgi:hypothetical protein
MITGFLLNALYIFLNNLITFVLVDGHLVFPQIFHDAFSFVGNVGFLVNQFFPFDTLIYVLGFMFSVELLVISVNVVLWLLAFIRG